MQKNGNLSGGCPVAHSPVAQNKATKNRDWWPNSVDLSILHQHSPASNPLGSDFDYAEHFSKLNLSEVKKSINAVMQDSKPWWPADYGHYGPLFIRMAWHSAGTYRTGDGRGGGATGTQRFSPLDSWPDNVNLDKARRLLWPVKQKYGKSLSWADLMILAGNCALESMGFKTFGFAGGRVDLWAPEEDVYWGDETKWLGDNRYSGDRDLQAPLAAVQMGLIYVNPEGPNGNPDPVASGKDIRETFARMAMNDEETVALVAGGHTFGKCHGAASDSYLEREPGSAELEDQGFGWKSNFKSGVGVDTISSGIEGAWTPNPIKWDMGYFDVLFGYEWELVKSPAGANQWHPKQLSDPDHAPQVDGSDNKVTIIMTTADMAMRMDPIYAEISKRFHANPDEFADAFARAWFKLTHRDMGPRTLYLGSEVPAEELLWQDNLPKADYDQVDAQDVDSIKQQIMASGIESHKLIKAAWASASTFRGSDKRGGANGARASLFPQIDWEVNQPDELKEVINALTSIKAKFDLGHGNKKISLADLIVLGGAVGIEAAATKAGRSIDMPFTPGRVDATQAQTDIHSFAALEPFADGFRNYCKSPNYPNVEHLLIDKAQLLTLSAPEMTALVGAMRVLGCNFDNSDNGVLTAKRGSLTNDFFVNLLDMANRWEPNDSDKQTFTAFDRTSGEKKWSASRIDLLFGSNSQLRAIGEVYASDDGESEFINCFISAWDKVMNADRFELL